MSSSKPLGPLGMHDMLVKLYELPPVEPHLARARAAGVEVRAASPMERGAVAEWARIFFGGWADQVDVAFTRSPVACFLALRDGDIVGFACVDIVPDVFGPTGVVPEERGNGVGGALLLAALQRLRDRGYAYAIIGGVGPAAYYEKVVGARSIEGSDPGLHGGVLLGAPASVLAARDE